MNRKPCGCDRSLLIALATSVVLAGSPASAAALAGEALAFERFMHESRPVCLEQPAADCVAVAWRFADENRDQGLSLVELAAVRAALEQWLIGHRDALSAPERSSIALGFLVVDSLGLERLHAIYDTDQDGLVDRSELLADLRLDQRPLGEVLLDPAAVDHRAVALRLGIPAALIESALPR